MEARNGKFGEADGAVRERPGAAGAGAVAVPSPGTPSPPWHLIGSPGKPPPATPAGAAGVPLAQLRVAFAPALTAACPCPASPRSSPPARPAGSRRAERWLSVGAPGPGAQQALHQYCPVSQNCTRSVRIKGSLQRCFFSPEHYYTPGTGLSAFQTLSPLFL